MPPKPVNHKQIWEILAEGHLCDTARMKVPGGWLYRSRDWANDDEKCSLALAFVPGRSEE